VLDATARTGAARIAARKVEPILRVIHLTRRPRRQRNARCHLSQFHIQAMLLVKLISLATNALKNGSPG